MIKTPESTFTIDQRTRCQDKTTWFLAQISCLLFCIRIQPRHSERILQVCVCSGSHSLACILHTVQSVIRLDPPC
jgi:hypothetical protein